jgi:hypothetical protein
MNNNVSLVDNVPPDMVISVGFSSLWRRDRRRGDPGPPQ